MLPKKNLPSTSAYFISYALTPFTRVFTVSYGLPCTQGVKSDAGAASEMEEMVVMQNTNYQSLHAELTKSIVSVPLSHPLTQL